MDEPDKPTATAAEGSEVSPETTPAVTQDRHSLIREMLRKTREPEAKPEGEGSPPKEEPKDDVLSQEPPAEEAGDEEEDDEAPAPVGRTPDELTRARARIRKLKEERKQTRAEQVKRDEVALALKREVEDLKRRIDPPKPADDLADETDRTVILRKQELAKTVYDQAEELLDTIFTPEGAEEAGASLEREGVKAPSDGWTVKGVRELALSLKKRARQTLEVAPRRLTWLDHEEASRKRALELVPDLANDESEIAKEAKALRTARPEIGLFPDHHMVTAAAVLGLREMKRLAAIPTITPKAPVKAAPAAAPKMPPVRSNEAKPSDQLTNLREKALRPGSTREDRQALVRAMMVK